MLSEDRQYYVTASQCHRVMASFETELEGRSAEKPERLDVLGWINDNKVLPKAGDLKAVDIVASGAEIKEAWTYYKSKIQVFSEGMESIATEIAMSQFINERDVNYNSKDMERGNLQEGEAVLKLGELLGIDFVDTEENQKFHTKETLGVTPDGIELGGLSYKSCAELKNPKDTTHMKYLSTLKSVDDMLKVCPEYYWQAQCGLYVTGAETYHWMSYHKGFKEGYQMVYIPIKPNPEHIDMLVERSIRVSERVPVIIESIKERYDY